jgi:hypothetical protein
MYNEKSWPKVHLHAIRVSVWNVMATSMHQHNKNKDSVGTWPSFEQGKYFTFHWAISLLNLRFVLIQ